MCDNETELIVYGSKSLGEQMVKWQYRVHGYIYNPEDGDMDHGVNPGTLLRINLTIGGCPSCGASKDTYKKLV
jgi:rubredoxin